MFIKSKTQAKLDAEILSAIEELESHEKISDEYGAIVERISKLHKLKTEERYKQISPDTVLVVAANIFGILWLARFEKTEVIKAPKAFGFIMKPR